MRTVESSRKARPDRKTARQRAFADLIASGARLPAPPKRVLELPKPPRGNRPAWLAGAGGLPKRDAAGLELFAEEYAAAERFWAWLGDCSAQTADRLRAGHAYLSGEGQRDDEGFALYEALLRCADWCETAYWLLARWYGPENPCPRLRLPLPDLHDGDGHRLTIVRELRGVPGEVLLEDAAQLADDRQPVTVPVVRLGQGQAQPRAGVLRAVPAGEQPVGRLAPVRPPQQGLVEGEALVVPLALAGQVGVPGPQPVGRLRVAVRQPRPEPLRRRVRLGE